MSVDFYRSSSTKSTPSPSQGGQKALPWGPWCYSTSRVVTFSLDTGGQFGAPYEYRSPTEFQTYLLSKNKPKRSIYMLEGLAPEFTSIIGDHFQLHPSVFADHHRLVAFSGRATGESGGLPFLPSSIRGRHHISLKYHEALTVCPTPIGFRNLCSATGRHLMATRTSGTFSEVMIARRKCTVWSRETESGGWDCLIICDPPIRQILTDSSCKRGFGVSTTPYNGGYPDFTPHDDQRNALPGPPLTSLLDDISYYIQNHSEHLDENDPCCVLLLIKRILASHFMKVFEFVESTLEKVQWTLSRRVDLSEFTLAGAEGHFSDIQAWERRVGEFKNDLLGIMLQLQIAPSDLDFGNIEFVESSVLDYRFLHRRVTEISRLISRVNTSLASLVSFTGGRSALKVQELSLKIADQSVRDANTVKALALLGLIFIPFSYTASLFSLADSYSPGGTFFWVYFAVSLPLTGLLLIGYWLLRNKLFI